MSQAIAKHLLVLLIMMLALTNSPPEVAAQPQPVPRDDPRFGAVQAINAPDPAVQAGVRWERIIFPWADMQPSSPDQLLQGYYTDAQIDGEVRRGVALVGVVVYTPAWAATDASKGGLAVPKGLDRPITDPNNAFARFMSKLAAKYKGRVDAWTIWNEPDAVNVETKAPYTWTCSEADFWLLQKSGYLAIKQANSDAPVLLPGFAYW